MVFFQFDCFVLQQPYGSRIFPRHLYLFCSYLSAFLLVLFFYYTPIFCDAHHYLLVFSALSQNTKTQEK